MINALNVILRFLKYIYYSINKLRKRFYRSKAFYVYELNEPPPVEVPLPKGISFQMLNKNRINSAQLASDMELAEWRYEKRLQRGDLCLAAFDENRIVHTSWIHKGPFYSSPEGYYRRCNSKTHLIYGVRTHPRYRRKGIYKSACFLLGKKLLREEANKIIELVDVDNMIPNKTLPQFHFKKTEFVNYIRLLKLNITVVKNITGALERIDIFISPPRGIPEL